MNLFTKVLPSLPLYLLLVLSSVGVITGDYFAKLWSTNTKTIFLILAFAGYLTSSFFYIPTLLKEGLIVTSIVWSLISIIGFLAIGFLIFKESLNTWQIVGICFGMISLLILTIAEHF
jgi:multidrug transporter EmrE-like cation transporter